MSFLGETEFLSMYLHLIADRGVFFLSQSAGSHSNTGLPEVWVGIDEICEEIPRQTHRNIGSLTIPTSFMYAYVGRHLPLHVDETLTLCPGWFDYWIEYENDAIGMGLDFRQLHIPFNGSPNDYQKSALRTLIARKESVKFLGRFFVSTLIHELSHTKAFTPQSGPLGKLQILTIDMNFAYTILGWRGHYMQHSWKATDGSLKP